MSSQTPLIPPAKDLHIVFAHGTYQGLAAFEPLGLGVSTEEVTDAAALAEAMPRADVLVISGLWNNALLANAPRLRYVQSYSAGYNQYDLAAFKAQGVMLASGQGVNRNAVSEHAIGLMLSLSRRLAYARDNQAKSFWRPGQADPSLREDELAGKTLLVVGLGGIGDRIAKIAKAMDMKVIGVRRDPARGAGAADRVVGFADVADVISEADVVVLSCPLTDETKNLIDAPMLAAMKPQAVLVNVARGGCVNEPDLIAALNAGQIAGAALDVTVVEPLPASSELWTMPNVIVTPHVGGETSLYEANVVAILQENLTRLWAGNDTLVNRIA